MNILICNDDGVHAPGIAAMANRMAALGHAATVVAPDHERSGAGHAITITSLHLYQKNFPEYDKRVRVFQCNGTPADCAALGVRVAAPEAELVLSGINQGSNLGCDVFYSGTVAAAREGYFENRRAIAVSLVMDHGAQPAELHYETAVCAAEVLTARLDVLFGEKIKLLNVNVPNLPLAEVRGFKVTFAGRRRYQDRIQIHEGRRGSQVSYWFAGTPANHEEKEGSDVRAVLDGFVSLTFLQHDTTDYELNAEARESNIETLALPMM